MPPGSASPSGNVHTVAENVIAIDDDVADVDAEPILDALLRRQNARRETSLHRDRTADRVDHAHKLDENPIAGRLDHATAVCSQLGIDALSPQRTQSVERALLVAFDKATVFRNIADQNSGQP